MITFTKQIRELDRWTPQLESILIKQGRKQKRNKGLFYHKGGAGIETNPFAKRGKDDNFNLRKTKGKPEIYKGLYRVKSKGEINELERGARK